MFLFLVFCFLLQMTLSAVVILLAVTCSLGFPRHIPNSQAGELSGKDKTRYELLLRHILSNQNLYEKDQEYKNGDSYNAEDEEISDDTRYDYPEADVPNSGRSIRSDVIGSGRSLESGHRLFEKRGSHDPVCDSICNMCSRWLTLAWSSLCWKDCQKGGHAFDTCLIVLSSVQTQK